MAHVWWSRTHFELGCLFLYLPIDSASQYQATYVTHTPLPPFCLKCPYSHMRTDVNLTKQAYYLWTTPQTHLKEIFDTVGTTWVLCATISQLCRQIAFLFLIKQRQQRFNCKPPFVFFAPWCSHVTVTRPGWNVNNLGGAPWEVLQDPDPTWVVVGLG